MTCDYYRILKLEPDATTEEIKRAYRRLAFRHHPDRNTSPDAHEHFIQINEAYLILSDDEARERYDAARSHTAGNRTWTEEREGAENADQSEDAASQRTYRFEDAELSGWAKNARRQAEYLAELDFAVFVRTVGDVAKEAGVQGVTAFIYAVSGMGGASAIFGIFAGLYYLNYTQLVISILIGIISIAGIRFTTARYHDV
jgi:hypothetical protein